MYHVNRVSKSGKERKAHSEEDYDKACADAKRIWDETKVKTIVRNDSGIIIVKYPDCNCQKHWPAAGMSSLRTEDCGK